MAKKIGDLGLQSRLYANLAVAYCALTNRCDEQGVGAAHAANDLDRRFGQLDHLAVPLIVLGQIYVHDMPDGGPRYVARSRGIQWSFVNGRPIIRDGRLPEPGAVSGAGRVIRAA